MCKEELRRTMGPSAQPLPLGFPWTLASMDEGIGRNACICSVGTNDRLIAPLQSQMKGMLPAWTCANSVAVQWRVWSREGRFVAPHDIREVDQSDA